MSAPIEAFNVEFDNVALSVELSVSAASSVMVVSAVGRVGLDVGLDAGFVQHEGTPLPEDAVETLCDLARADAEPEFKDLARMLGVAIENLDAMWAGTKRRIKKSS